MSQQWKWLSNFCLYYVAGMSHMALPRFWEVEFSGPEGSHPAGLVHREMPALWSGGQRPTDVSTCPVQKSYCLGSVDFLLLGSERV